MCFSHFAFKNKANGPDTVLNPYMFRPLSVAYNQGVAQLIFGFFKKSSDLATKFSYLVNNYFNQL